MQLICEVQVSIWPTQAIPNELDDGLLSEEINQQSTAPGKFFHDKESGMWLLWFLCLDYQHFMRTPKYSFKTWSDSAVPLTRRLGSFPPMGTQNRAWWRTQSPTYCPRTRQAKTIMRYSLLLPKKQVWNFSCNCCTLWLANMAHWYHYCFLNVSLKEYIYILLSEGMKNTECMVAC